MSELLLHVKTELTRRAFVLSSTVFILSVAAVGICLSILFTIVLACECHGATHLDA